MSSSRSKMAFKVTSSREDCPCLGVNQASSVRVRLFDYRLTPSPPSILHSTHLGPGERAPVTAVVVIALAGPRRAEPHAGPRPPRGMEAAAPPEEGGPGQRTQSKAAGWAAEGQRAAADVRTGCRRGDQQEQGEQQGDRDERHRPAVSRAGGHPLGPVGWCLWVVSRLLEGPSVGVWVGARPHSAMAPCTRRHIGHIEPSRDPLSMGQSSNQGARTFTFPSICGLGPVQLSIDLGCAAS